MAKTDRTDHTQPGSELAFHNAVFLAPPIHLATTVDTVLEAREANSVSTSAEQQFEAAVKASGISPPKFENRPHRAPVSQLFTPVCDEVVLSDQLAGSVFRIWVECEKGLRDSVEDYAKSNGLPVEGPDYKNRRFRDWMPLKAWNSSVGGITGGIENSHPPHDVSLMLSMVTGQLPGLVKQATGVDAGTIDDLPFDGWLEELKTSLSSPAGPYAAARFINAATRLVEDAQRQEKRTEDLIGKSSEVCSVYMQELVFLGRELPASLLDPRRALAGQAEGLDDALNVIEQLAGALEEFRAASLVDYATWDLREKGMKKEAEAASRVHSLIEQLHAALPEPVEEPEPDVVPAPLTDNTTADADTLRAMVQHLKTEKKELKAQLVNANRRLAAQWNRDNKEANPPEASPVESVGEAVARAQTQFEGQGLLFYLNRASNIDTEFERPADVFDALEWLATTYRDGKMNGAMSDPELSLKTIKPTCSAWKYAPSNSAAAMNKHPEAYSTRAPDGKTYSLAHHLKRGVENEERHTIRIAWDWDDEQQMVVIGYIGKHQPSRY